MDDLIAALYPPDPIDRGHPLNRGRVAWWLGLPPLDGGRRWHDVAGSSHGTLANMDPAESGWRVASPSTLPGSVLFDGVDDSCDMGAPAALASLTAAVSLAAWCRPSGGLNTFAAIAGLEYALPRAWPYVTYKIDGAGVGGRMCWELGTADGNLSVLDSGIALAAGTWYRIVGTFDGSSQSVYVDGALAATARLATTLGWAGGTFRVGSNSTGGENFGGHVRDVSAWDRALDAGEVRADHDLSRRGYPGVLRRDVRSSTFPLAAVVASRRAAVTEFATAAGPRPVDARRSAGTPSPATAAGAGAGHGGSLPDASAFDASGFDGSPAGTARTPGFASPAAASRPDPRRGTGVAR